MVRCAAAIAVAALAVLGTSGAAAARPTFDVRAGVLSFFSDVLGIVARDGATVRFANGTSARADAAYVDLVNDRIILAGTASAARTTQNVSGDVIAIDLDAGIMDVLDATSGMREGKLDLANFADAPINRDRFAFPDLDERRSYIRARRATVTAHANVRFSPAAFPTSPGSLPVPSYLFTFAANPSFGANALGGATFDQPYGISGGATSLLAAHLRYEDGIGPTFALEDHRVYGESAYIVTSIDSPQRPNRLVQLTAYQRMGPRLAQTLDASADRFSGGAHYGLSGVFGKASARLDFSRFGEGTTLDVAARTADRHLLYGITARLRADFGFDSVTSSELAALPDRANYRTVWRHGIDVFVATPLVRAPFGAKLAATFDAARIWYGFPHRRDRLNANLTASRRVSRSLTLVGGYASSYSYDIYPGAQSVFYPAPAPPRVAPDGTQWPGYSAFTGAAMSRGYTLDAYYAPGPNTSVRVSVAHANDFPQFHGFGNPPTEVRFDARIRPLPNVGLAFGRAYDFGWGGRRFSRWTFTVLP